MNTFVLGVITKRSEEIGFNVYKVLKMPERQVLLEDLYHYVRYVKPCKAELTTVALDSDRLTYCDSVAKLDLQYNLNKKESSV